MQKRILLRLGLQVLIILLAIGATYLAVAYPD
jgi:hypothetical protein